MTNDEPRLRAQGVCIRFNLILFVLVLVAVLEIRIIQNPLDMSCVRFFNPER